MPSNFHELVLNESPVGVVLTTPDGLVVHWTKGVEVIFGYTAEEAVGRSLGTRTMVAGLELYGLRKDTAEFPVEIRLSPIRTEEGEFVMSAIRDISERKKAEQKFRGLLESAPDAIVIVNRIGEIVLVNSQTENMFGYPREELLGQKIEILIPKRYCDKHPTFRTGFFSEPRTRSMGAGVELFG